MSRAARSLFIFSIYVGVVGAWLILSPNSFLRLFGFPPTDQVWIRIVGMCFGALAFYYSFSSVINLRPFIQLTVYARALTLPFFILLVTLSLTQPVLILFGVIDLAGAVWTEIALRRTDQVPRTNCHSR
ncbi:MAG TPA: hypothetical protein VI729_05135 [Anaerolineales bacterium]|nr:hypothetical protein [Anaerolineales bacterium]